MKRYIYTFTFQEQEEGVLKTRNIIAENFQEAYNKFIELSRKAKITPDIDNIQKQLQIWE